MPSGIYTLRGLLQHNYLPNQKKRKDVLPRLFSSVSFTPSVAVKVRSCARKSKDFSGYDVVEYKSTRFDGMQRALSIPHPTGYADLCLEIRDSWPRIYRVCLNRSSRIRPMRHRDGRLIVMDYGSWRLKAQQHLYKAFAQRYQVHADISQFFPSIYTHAIAWALVTRKHAKQNRGLKHWFNCIDSKFSALKRRETQGVAIGPATSNIAAEVILERVDQVLRNERFVFHRFIDDYAAFCDSEDRARCFVRRLGEELAEYKLHLNAGKTRIDRLPQPTDDDWVGVLSAALPTGPTVSQYQVVQFLNLAVATARGNPDGSVLKYAFRGLLAQSLDPGAEDAALRYGLNLSFHQPVLIPLLEPLLDATSALPPFSYSAELNLLALEGARMRQSDTMVWTLYYLNKHKVPISSDVAEAMAASSDCLALLVLYLSGEKSHQDLVMDFLKSLTPDDLHEHDQYWLLLYELFRLQAIQNPYKGDDSFEVLRDQGVHFT